MQMGHPFVKRNWQSKRLEFLVYQQEHSELFEKSWNLFQEEYNLRRLGGAPAVPALGGGPAIPAIQDSTEDLMSQLETALGREEALHLT